MARILEIRLRLTARQLEALGHLIDYAENQAFTISERVSDEARECRTMQERIENVCGKVDTEIRRVFALDEQGRGQVT